MGLRTDRMTDIIAPEHGDSNARRAASGAAWMSVEMVTVQGISLLVFAVMAHFINPADFGLMSICLVTIQALKTLFLDNFAYSVMRKANAAPIEYTTAFWLT